MALWDPVKETVEEAAYWDERADRRRAAHPIDYDALEAALAADEDEEVEVEVEVEVEDE
jgi:hypothetical protein